MAILQYTQTTTGYIVAPRITSASSGSVNVDNVSSSVPSPYDLPREIKLPTRDFEMFLAELNRDVPPAPKLIRAAEAFKRKRR